MPDYIPVAFCFDEYYARFAPVAIHSLIETSKTPLKVYCIMPAEAEGRVTSISILAETYDFIHLIYCDTSGLSGLKANGHITLASYLRLFIPDLIKEEKVLYLDVDIVVRRDLADLYALDLGEDHLIAAIADKAAESCPMAGLISDDYVNSGVLLLNNKALRAEKLFETCMTINRREREYVMWADQCLINRFAEGRKLVVGSDWNHMVFPNGILEAHWRAVWESQTIAIVHFVGPAKPWTRSSNPFVTRDWLLQAGKLNAAGFKRLPATRLHPHPEPA